MSCGEWLLLKALSVELVTMLRLLLITPDNHELISHPPRKYIKVEIPRH